MAMTTEQLPSQALLWPETLAILSELVSDNELSAAATVAAIRSEFDAEFLTDLTDSALVLFLSELGDEARCAGCAEPVGWDICCDHMEEIRTGQSAFLNDYEDCRF